MLQAGTVNIAGESHGWPAVVTPGEAEELPRLCLTGLHPGTAFVCLLYLAHFGPAEAFGEAARQFAAAGHAGEGGQEERGVTPRRDEGGQTTRVGTRPLTPPRERRDAENRTAGEHTWTSLEPGGSQAAHRTGHPGEAARVSLKRRPPGRRPER